MEDVVGTKKLSTLTLIATIQPITKVTTLNCSPAGGCNMLLREDGVGR